MIVFRLSLLYDIIPIPYGNELSLNIDNISGAKDFGLLLSTCNYYGLDKNKAKELIEDIVDIVEANFDKLCKTYGINRGQIEEIRSAITTKKELFI